ncbi:hypothetical protein [Cryobacterium ruanii]|uniref:Uncharacterized protein n=1 Tax=Cryobacterium ruanii TaxID=1259197 RepID=A0A4R9AP96_9MICO|nr:hypothetical protein [Cryobacterium ruanii]TFD66353.1 hypothetical protein E3T47_07570 [Cryobacterium ruanii]
MNRIDIVYGGKPYSLGGRSIESVQVEIDGALAAGLSFWLRVNSGEGRFEDAYLLIAPGIAVAMVNVKPNGVDHTHDGDEWYEQE